MDVHPPHEPIRGWKDFLLHLLTITVGLFIALSLEAAVESMHHRHLVHDARAALSREITDNHALYAENERALHANRVQLQNDIAQLRELRDGRRLDHPALTWTWRWSSYADAAWRTSRDSGAVTHMTPETISGYSYVYTQQDYVNASALGIINEETRAGAALAAAGDPARLTPADIGSLLIRTAELDQSIATLQTTMKLLDDDYVRALNGH